MESQEMYEVDTVVRDYLAVVEEKDNEIVSLTKENNALRLKHQDLERQLKSAASDNGILCTQTETLRQQLHSALETVKQTAERQLELELCLTDVATTLSSSSPFFSQSIGNGPSVDSSGHNIGSGREDMSHLCVVISEAVSDLLERFGEMVEVCARQREELNQCASRARVETCAFESKTRVALQEEEKARRRSMQVVGFSAGVREVEQKNAACDLLRLVNHDKYSNASAGQEEMLSLVGELKAELLRQTKTHDEALKEIRRNQIVSRHERSRAAELRSTFEAQRLENEFFAHAFFEFSHYTSLQLRACASLAAEFRDSYSDAHAALRDKEAELLSTQEMMREVKTSVKHFQRDTAETNKVHNREVEELHRGTEESRRLFEHENSQLKSKVVSLQTTMMQMRTKGGAMATQLEKAELECATLRNDLAKAQDQQKRARHDRDVVAAAARKQTASFESFQADTEAQLKSLRGQVQSGMGHVQTLQVQLTRKTQECDLACTAAETAVEECDELQQRVAGLELELSESQKKSSDLEAQLNSERRVVSELQAQHASARESADDLGRHVDELKLQVLRYNDRLVEKSGEVDALKGEISRAAENSRVENSVVSAELSIERKNAEKLKGDMMANSKAWEVQNVSLAEENRRLTKKVLDLEMACELSVRHINELREELCRRRAPR